MIYSLEGPVGFQVLQMRIGVCSFGDLYTDTRAHTDTFAHLPCYVLTLPDNQCPENNFASQEGNQEAF